MPTLILNPKKQCHFVSGVGKNTARSPFTSKKKIPIIARHRKRLSAVIEKEEAWAPQ